MPEYPSGKIDYQALLARFPWVIEREQNCVLSPDSDGLLCGLFMSNYLAWKIRGFYDGKVLLSQQGIQPRECVFLDMEIYRTNIRSIGQHMVLFDKNNLPRHWGNFDNCIAANNLRNFDFKSNFKQKYPFGTIHLLLAILGQRLRIPIPKSAVSALLYADGTFKNQFNYPENCLDWLDFLRADQSQNPLQKVFLDRQYATYELMVALKDLFSEIMAVGGGKRGGDKIKISDSKGRIININTQSVCLDGAVINQSENLLRMLAQKTEWIFNPLHWSWGPYCASRLKKGSVKPGKARYHALLKRKPVSLAIISRSSIEYTLDSSRVF